MSYDDMVGLQYVADTIWHALLMIAFGDGLLLEMVRFIEIVQRIAECVHDAPCIVIIVVYDRRGYSNLLFTGES